MALKFPLSLLAAALISVGCATPAPGPAWSAWQPIDPTDSLLAATLPNNADTVVKRRTDTQTGTIEEVWEWQTGQLQMIMFESGAHTWRTFRDPSDLRWNMASGEITVPASNVGSATNGLGTFVYGTVATRQGNCFLYSQGVPMAHNDTDYDRSMVGSRGVIRGIDCRQDIALDETTAHFMPMLASLSLR